jgi:putative transcriptional regulator
MNSRKRPPLAERLRIGLEQALRHAQGEITLPTHVIEIPDPPPKYSAKAICKIRESRGMTQWYFASLLGVSDKTVQSWEQGVRRPSPMAMRLLQSIEDPGFLASHARPQETRSRKRRVAKRRKGRSPSRS